MPINTDIKIIGIYGPSGAGKDTLAKVIQNSTMAIKHVEGMMLMFSDILHNRRLEMLDYSRFEVKKFATAPKQIVADLLNVPLEKMEDREFKHTHIDKYGKTVLQLIIDVAQGMRSIVGDTVWCDILMNQHKDQFWLITDLRFPCEYDAIKSKGGLCIRLKNPGVKSDLPIDNLLDDRQFDFTITNNFKHNKVMIWDTLKFLKQYNLFNEYEDDEEYLKQLLKGE